MRQLPSNIASCCICIQYEMLPKLNVSNFFLKMMVVVSRNVGWLFQVLPEYVEHILRYVPACLPSKITEIMQYIIKQFILYD